MTVTVATIRGMNPRAFADTAGELRKAATKLADQCEAYQRSVEHPLAAGHGWRGGGQPDAVVVTTVNALAYGTSSMRLRASSNVLTGASHAMTKAQRRLADVEREVEGSGLSLGDDGVVREPAASAVPVGPRGGRAVTPVSGDVDGLQRKVDGIVLFASAADHLARKQLASYTKPLITTQTADRQLLRQARADNGAAAEHLLGSIGVEDLLSTARPRPLSPGHTLETVQRYFVAYAPAALDAVAIFAGTWMEATAAVDLALGRWARPAAGDGPVAALAVGGALAIGAADVYLGNRISGWGGDRLHDDLAMARAETKGTGSASRPPKRGEVTCRDGVKRGYEPNPKHAGARGGGRISPPPSDPLNDLRESIPVKGTSEERLAVDPKNREYVVFRRHNLGQDPPTYHGYRLTWKGKDGLDPEQRAALIKAGVVRSTGKIIGR